MVGKKDKKDLKVPDMLPLLPVKDVVLFPDIVLPLFVGREASISAVDEAMARDKLLFLTAQKNMHDEVVTPERIYNYGCIGEIVRIHKLPPPDNRIKILVQGMVRGKILEYLQQKPNYFVRVAKVVDKNATDVPVEISALMRDIKENLEKIISLGKILSPDILLVMDDVNSPGKLADLVAANLGLKVDQSQDILETADPFERLKKVHEFVKKEIEILSVKHKIQNQARDEMTKMQKEFFLREQMKAIKSELGDQDPKSDDLRDLKNRIERSDMPKEALEEARKQFKRLENMHPDAAEASIIRTYLDWLTELSWTKGSKDNIDIKQAQKILDEDHYNLKKVKERVLEFLSVVKLKKKLRGPILCFAGPPGVGKTSLGRSIARAMGREFVRMSLGGMKDEAEIRGHRRTYVGAMPGKIIHGIKQAGTNNPVFMLDEVDKIGADFRGDPSSALLEVLDPEQNYSFKDHYLNLPYDLSHVMFICTANLMEPIPPALRDRMEIINIPGYTIDDKLQIAKEFLIKKQIKENGIDAKKLNLSDSAINSIVEEYTKESGVRNLEREIAAVCRKIAREVAEGNKKPVKINASNLHKYLGAPRYILEEERKKNEIGIVPGLAWTQAGGEIMYIETNIMTGKGDITLTGNLGEVMKESAKAGLSYARSRAKELGIDENFHKNRDIHIHVPAGAIPKDGPSAGITMTTALISALSGIPVNHKVAMTGEVTLRGRVLPIGGLKEKVLAAKRAKIEKVLVPSRNKRDVEELPKEIRKSIKIELVNHMDQVLSHSLVKTSKRKKAADAIPTASSGKEKDLSV